MGSFLDVTLPPFLLAVMAGAVVTVCVVINASKLRTYAVRRRTLNAQRNRITSAPARHALVDARDVLRDAINDPFFTGELRDRVITAYDHVNTVLEQENVRR